MIQKYFLIIITLLTYLDTTHAQTHMVSGRVSCENKPLPNATVIVRGTTLGATTSDAGSYMINGINSDTCELIVFAIGFAPTSLFITFTNSNAIANIAIEQKSSELEQVVVTGVSKATGVRENPLAMELISLKQIEHSSEPNVIDAIAMNAPGFTAVKTGPNVSKPFINGLGYNRVLTLYDGMRVETQQWGDEHGVPLDDYLIERAEVIKGPASLMYGSDAIAGVLSLFPAHPHDTDRLIHGKLTSEYQTNNGLIGNALQLSYANAHWAWALHGSERLARNYTDKIDERVYNTGFKTANASGFMGYQCDKGYTHLSFTLYDNRQGIPDGSRDSLTRKFTYQQYEIAGENTLQPAVDDIKNRPQVSNAILNAYSLSPLSQRIQDYRLYTDNNYTLGQGTVNASAGIEQNIRREYDHPTDPGQAGEYIILNTLNYGLRYNAPTFLNVEPSVGINGMYQQNTNGAATDFPIPTYHLFDIGGYVYGKWKKKRWVIAGGIRYDRRTEEGDGLYISANPVTGFFRAVIGNDTVGAVRQFTPFKLDFEGVTGSIGLTYKINNQLSIKGNIGRGYRAPNITEIASNGLDPGAHIVYQGNLDFKPEFSLQEDIGISGSYPDISLGMIAFNNYIQNYIYEDQKVDAQGNPVVIVPGNKTFQYQQTNAILYGMDITLNIHPQILDGFYFNNAASFVYGYNLNPKYRGTGVGGEYLPFTPPPRLLSSICYDIPLEQGSVRLIGIKAGSDLNLAQNRYLGLYKTETPTPAYIVCDASVNTEIKYFVNKTLKLQVAVNNVLNTAYQSHLSRLQYFEYYTSSPNGHYGIYNMGRNIVFKLIVPF